MEQFQNWEYTVLTKSKTKQTGEKACNRAGQQGQTVETITKQATNKKGQMTGQAMYKAVEEENYTTKVISHDFKIALQQARTAKKYDQKTLAGKINEKQSIISDYESGRAIPNNQVISKLERVLGCKLPRCPKPKKQKEDD